MRMRVRLRIITIMEAILAFIGFLVIVCIAHAGEKARARDLMEAYTEGIANGISTFFTRAEAIAAAATTLPSVQELDWDSACMDLAGFARSNSHMLGITLADANGYVYDTYPTGPSGNPWQGGRRTEDNTVPDSPPITIRDLPNFRRLVEENVHGEFFIVVNEPYVPDGLTEKVFVTAAPIIKNGRSIGSVSVAQTTLDLSLVYEDLSMDFLDKFGRNAHIFLVSEGRQLVSSLSYNERYGAYMDELFGSDETVSIDTLGEGIVSAVKEAVNNDRLVVTAKVDGEPHLFSGVKIVRTPFAVCLAVSRSYMLKTARSILAASVAFFLLFVAAYFVARALIGRRPAPPHGGGKDEGGGRPGKRSPNLTRWRGRLGEDLDAPVLPLQ